MKREWHEVTVARRVAWSADLISVVFDADIGPFRAGQFIDVALEPGGAGTSRSYSLASAPEQPPELFVSLVAGGELTPRLFSAPVGASVWLRWPAAGVFTLERLPDARHLWLLATGTGLAPYLSMLRTEQPWQRFERIVVAHGVRSAQGLAYRDELSAHAARHPGRLSVVPVVSRDPGAAGVLHGRITTAWDSGELEARAGLAMRVEDAQVMLCGNPRMVDEMRLRLEAAGYSRNSPRSPGQFTYEAYW